MSGPGDPPPEILGWLHEVLCPVQLDVQRRPGGASRAGWAVDAVAADGTVVPLWLRGNAPEAGPRSGDGAYDSLAREAAVYRALSAAGLPVPAVRAVHPSGDAFVAERVDGRHRFSEIDDDGTKDAVARDYMAHLARLHRLEVADLDLAELGPLATMPELIDREIDEWDRRIARGGLDDPLLALALVWLRENRPADLRRVVLAHGDPGPGNFLFVGRRVVALLDWELAHWGDPCDDLGWVFVHDLQERFGDLGALVDVYEAALGETIDRDRLRYFRILAATRCAGGILSALGEQPLSPEFANLLIYGTLHYRALTELLCEVLGPGPDVPAVLDLESTSPLTAVFDQGLDELRRVIVPAIDEPFARRRALGLVRSLKFLRAMDRLGDRFARQEADELAALVGSAPTDLAAGRAALAAGVRSGAVAKGSALGYCVHEASRRTELCRDAMGAFADRHYSPLR